MKRGARFRKLNAPEFSQELCPQQPPTLGRELQLSEKEPLRVVFSMDCVPPGAAPWLSGPRSWASAFRSMTDFAAALQQEGLLGTFFVVPESLNRLEEPLSELRATGMELGLLCHPQISNYTTYVGAYGYDRQREIIRVACRMWEEAAGGPAASFRAGFFSANDYTFQILCMEGFQQSSCSLPGRVDDEQCSLWERTFPLPHHTDPLDRKIKGTMELYEVPVTSDFEARTPAGIQTFTPPHLRIENPGISEYAEGLIEKHLDNMPADSLCAKTITFVTRNSVDWGRAEDPHVDRLHNLVAMLRKVAKRRDLKLTGSTLASVHQEADRRWQARWGAAGS